jgi:zinc-finger of transposase IS204/IS1001/IS1096/IS1165
MTELVRIVFSGLSALVIGDVEDAGYVIAVRARTPGGLVACPGCGTETARVHGYHERTAADVPVDGLRVLVRGPGPSDALPGHGLPAADLPPQIRGRADSPERRASSRSAWLSTWWP